MDVKNTSPYQDKLDPYSSHSLIHGWLKRFPAQTRVLDVGTATGTLGRLCQGSGFVVDGLEPDAGWAEQAKPFYAQVIPCTLDEAGDNFLAGHQVVILADVLEHMPAPEKSLQRLVDLQPDGATFMVSVPNIANLWVRLSLLFGRFNYTDRGILDRTHLRFFTRSTFIRFLRGAGLTVRRIQPTPIPLQLVSPFFSQNPVGRLAHRALAGLTRLLPTLLGYQFVAELVKL